MQTPTQRANSVAVSLSSTDGRGEARKLLRVWDGKKTRAMIPGMFRQASRAKANWIVEGIVMAVVDWKSAHTLRAPLGKHLCRNQHAIIKELDTSGVTSSKPANI